MQEVITELEAKSKKPSIPDVRSGDSVKVHQKIQEGKKERVQIFEGTVIRTRRLNSLTATITVRRLASGVGVEKTYFLHSPNVVKVDITKRGRVRRNYLTYLRARQGKATRLTSLDFDIEAANKQQAEPAEAKIEPAAKTSKEPAKAEVKAKPAKAEQPAPVKAKAESKDSKGTAEPAKLSKADLKKAKAEEFRKKHQ